MPKILAVNPWIYDFAAYNLWLKPLGFLYLLEYLKELNFDVDYVDCLDDYVPDNFGGGKFRSEEVSKPLVYRDIPRKYKRYGMPEQKFSSLIENRGYDYVLVTSGMTYWYPGVFRTIELIKKRFPNVPVVLGGNYATLCKNHAAEYSGADMVVPNGELNKLAVVLGTGEFITPAIIYGRPIRYSMYKNLDSAAIRTIIGCPYSCGYCAVNMLNPKIFKRKKEYIIEEIQRLCSRGVKNLAFYDDALLYNEDFKWILEEIIRKKIKCNFYTPNALHARLLDGQTAELMFKTNFIEPRFGLEFAGGEAVSYHDKVSFDELVKAVDVLRRSGYKKGSYSAYILIGLPSEDYGLIKEKTMQLFELGVRVRLAEYSPIPDTAFYKKYFGERINDPLKHNNSIFPLLDDGENKKAQELKIYVKAKGSSLYF